MKLEPMPIVPVIEWCQVRTYRDRYEWLSWTQLFALGVVGPSAAAW